MYIYMIHTYIFIYTICIYVYICCKISTCIWPIFGQKLMTIPRVIALLCLSWVLEVGDLCAGLDRLAFIVSVPYWLKY